MLLKQRQPVLQDLLWALKLPLYVMFKPIAADFGWSRSTVSFAFFLQMSLFAISLSLVGRLYDRYGPKWVIIISTLFISIGYMFISFTDSLWQFLLFYGVIAAVGLGGTSVPIFALIFGFTFFVTAPLTPILVGKLFRFSHVGLISGFIMTFHYLGGGIGAYVGGLIFDKTGSYQNAFLLLAIISLAAVFCCIWIKEKRHHPVEKQPVHETAA